MSSIVEKVLLIGFGAIICLNLFSIVIPLFGYLQSQNSNQNNNQDIFQFYEIISQIKRKGKIAQQLPGEELEIEVNLTLADALQFSKSSNSTFNLEMEFQNKLYFEIIEFQSDIILWRSDSASESQICRFTRNGEGEQPISLTIVLSYRTNVLWFEFLK